ncbi:hypothetical protein [Rhizobium leguminosarum]|uniref:hypothetical protein n=1 Tax=Rhizobium leguminosarum TaxID=384 RepID=UPI0039656504
MFLRRSGGHWRDLPERLGDYRSVKRRYYRWIEMRKLAQLQTTFAVSEPSFSACAKGCGTTCS